MNNTETAIMILTAILKSKENAREALTGPGIYRRDLQIIDAEISSLRDSIKALHVLKEQDKEKFKRYPGCKALTPCTHTLDDCLMCVYYEEEDEPGESDLHKEMNKDLKKNCKYKDCGLKGDCFGCDLYEKGVK